MPVCSYFGKNRYFARRGAKVAGLDLNPKALDETIECVMKDKPAPSGEVIVQPCDVTHPSSVQEGTQFIICFGQLDLFGLVFQRYLTSSLLMVSL